MKVNLGLYMNAKRSYSGGGELNSYAVRNIEQLLAARSRYRLANLNVQVLLARDDTEHLRSIRHGFDTQKETHWDGAYEFDPLKIIGESLTGPVGKRVEGDDSFLLRQHALASFISRLRRLDGEANALVLWGHADGPRGFLFSLVSKTPGVFKRDILSPLEVERALEESGKNLPRLQLLCMDSCQGACLEFACVLPKFAEYFIASQTPVPGTGWNYGSWPGILNAADGKDWEKTAAEISNDFVSSSPENSSISVLRLDSIEAVRKLLGEVAIQFLNNPSACQKLINARASIPTPGENRGGLVDVVSLFDETANLLGSGQLSDLCIKLSDAMLAATVSSSATADAANNYRLSGCSIFFPIDGISYGEPWNEITKRIYFDSAEQLSSFRKTRWPELMRKLVPSAARDLPHA
jgi:hypothetical protein